MQQIAGHTAPPPHHTPCTRPAVASSMPDSRRCQAWHHALATEAPPNTQHGGRSKTATLELSTSPPLQTLLSGKTELFLTPVSCCCSDTYALQAFSTSWNKTRGSRRSLPVDLQERCDGGGCGRGFSVTDEHRRCFAVSEPAVSRSVTSAGG